MDNIEIWSGRTARASYARNARLQLEVLVPLTSRLNRADCFSDDHDSTARLHRVATDHSCLRHPILPVRA
jgi:hypothetical protein